MADERWGERPKAFVVTKPGASVDEQVLREHVRQRIAGYKVPDAVDVVDALPNDLDRQDAEVRAAGRGAGRRGPQATT